MYDTDTHQRKRVTSSGNVSQEIVGLRRILTETDAANSAPGYRMSVGRQRGKTRGKVKGKARKNVMLSFSTGEELANRGRFLFPSLDFWKCVLRQSKANQFIPFKDTL